jgi:hypothetical protein
VSAIAPPAQSHHSPTSSNRTKESAMTAWAPPTIDEDGEAERTFVNATRISLTLAAVLNTETQSTAESICALLLTAIVLGHVTAKPGVSSATIAYKLKEGIDAMNELYHEKESKSH